MTLSSPDFIFSNPLMWPLSGTFRRAPVDITATGLSACPAGCDPGAERAPYRNQPVLPVSGVDMGIVHAMHLEVDAQRDVPVSNEPNPEIALNVLGQHGGEFIRAHTDVLVPGLKEGLHV